MIAIKPRWVKSTAMSGPAAVGETSVTQNQGFILMNLSAKAVSSRVNIIGHGLHGAEQSFIRLARRRNAHLFYSAAVVRALRPGLFWNSPPTLSRCRIGPDERPHLLLVGCVCRTRFP
ncbi:Hypothetical protein SMAX5B_010589 [Scophthalmus maximus]|uniref:Uncharacterized protein n=1 Tax=Scophthalmus maximus TaxID=52904 RepID=A0A2U9B305_SCOMX|nr:Hypothetical protein SMAX5B_010589 [Scophthalmus maximus]